MSETNINKYQEGKIYKLLNTVNTEVYVGSTCQKLLSKRMGKHREDAKINSSPIYTLMKELGIDKFYIELIESYPCNSKDELRKRESEWIRKIGTLNRRIECRTSQEYWEENKDSLKKKSKLYRETHKDTLSVQRREHYNNNKEDILQKQKESYAQNKDIIQEKQKTYRREHKEEISLQKKEYYEENKSKINEYKKEWYEKNKETVIARVKANSEANKEHKQEYDKKRYEEKKEGLSVRIECPCGGCYTVMSKNKHVRTHLHKKYEDKNINRGG